VKIGDRLNQALMTLPGRVIGDDLATYKTPISEGSFSRLLQTLAGGNSTHKQLAKLANEREELAQQSQKISKEIDLLVRSCLLAVAQGNGEAQVHLEQSIETRQADLAAALRQMQAIQQKMMELGRQPKVA
jgi:predicted lipid-binding transport protein (Tim44 family)